MEFYYLGRYFLAISFLNVLLLFLAFIHSLNKYVWTSVPSIPAGIRDMTIYPSKSQSSLNWHSSGELYITSSHWTVKCLKSGLWWCLFPLVLSETHSMGHPAWDTVWDTQDALQKAYTFWWLTCARPYSKHSHTLFHLMLIEILWGDQCFDAYFTNMATDT